MITDKELIKRLSGAAQGLQVNSRNVYNGADPQAMKKNLLNTMALICACISSGVVQVTEEEAVAHEEKLWEELNCSR